MQNSISRNVAASIALLFSASAFADAGSIEVSAGLAWVNGGNVESPVLNAKAENNVTPVITLTYYATKNIALSSEAGISRHEFHNTTGSLGKASIIPANVTAQWHFAPDGAVDPYIGAGLNYCFFINQTGALGTLKHIDPTLGGVLQVGANIATGDKWFTNIDYKHLWIRPDLEASGGGKIEQINLDPDIVTLSFGMRF
jgi:outer membrane protein